MSEKPKAAPWVPRAKKSAENATSDAEKALWFDLYAKPFLGQLEDLAGMVALSSKTSEILVVSLKDTYETIHMFRTAGDDAAKIGKARLKSLVVIAGRGGVGRALRESRKGLDKLHESTSRRSRQVERSEIGMTDEQLKSEPTN